MSTHDDHDHEDDDEAHLDPRLGAGWEALAAGDIAAARAAASACVDGEETHLEAVMLEAACQREEGDVEGALRTLATAAKEDPEWCTPELWMAELLSEEPEQLTEALRHARRALDLAEEEDEYLAALATKAAIELGLGRPTEARATLGGLPAADVPLDDPRVTLDFAELLLEAGDVDDARARLQRLLADDPNLADAWYLLGVAAEVAEDEEGKRAAWLRARALDLDASDGGASDEGDEGGDDEGGPALSEEELVAIAEETLASMPPEIRRHLKEVPIIVAEVPAVADVAAGMDPRALGLFNGTTHAESGGVVDPPTLTEIVLFRRNIERVADDEDELRDEVRTTLLHEAGHFFGLDEAALARLGLN